MGDLDQCIYRWRHAHSDLFADAIDTGRYFGIDWPSKTDETTQRSYRARPALVRAANGIAEATFSDLIRQRLRPFSSTCRISGMFPQTLEI